MTICKQCNSSDKEQEIKLSYKSVEINKELIVIGQGSVFIETCGECGNESEVNCKDNTCIDCINCKARQPTMENPCPDYYCSIFNEPVDATDELCASFKIDPQLEK